MAVRVIDQAQEIQLQPTVAGWSQVQSAIAGLEGGKLSLAGGAMTGPLAMGGQAITNVASPAGNADAATKAYVDDKVDALSSGLDWQDSVLDKDLASPPTSPTAGDRYIVASGATGDWLGQDHSIAEWDGSAWQFSAPSEGTAAWVEDEDKHRVWNGGAWVPFGSSSTGITSIDGVSNPGGNLDLVGGASIAITPDDANNQVTIALSETITQTPAGSAVPKADGAGKLDLAWLKTGSGNGLDSDSVDGVHAAALARRPGSFTANHLASFDADGDPADSGLATTAGPGIASLNLAVLEADPPAPDDGDFWLRSDHAARARIDGATYTLGGAGLGKIDLDRTSVYYNDTRDWTGGQGPSLAGVLSRSAAYTRLSTGTTAGETVAVWHVADSQPDAGFDLGMPYEAAFQFRFISAAPTGKAWLDIRESDDHGGDPTGRCVGFRLDNDQLKGIVHDGVSLTVVDLGLVLTPGQQRNVRALVSAGGVVFYVDGEKLGSTAAAPSDPAQRMSVHLAVRNFTSDANQEVICFGSFCQEVRAATGEAGWHHAALAADATLGNGDWVEADASAEDLTLTLKAAPTVGDAVAVHFAAGGPGRTVTLDRNGATIASQASDLVLFVPDGVQSPGDFLALRYSGSTWVIERDSRVCHAARLIQTSGQSIPDDAMTAIEFDASGFDVGALGDLVNGQLVIRRSGRYQLAGSVHLSCGAAGVQVMARVRVSGAAVLDARRQSAGAGVVAEHVSGVVELAAGDVVSLEVYQNSGAPITTETGAPLQPTLSATEVR